MAETPEQPRLAPIAPREWPEAMRAALGAIRIENPRHPFPSTDGRPKGLNLLGTFAHHPDLTKAYNAFNGHVLFGTTLSTRQRELLVLRVAVVRGADYEHAQHVALGLDVGLTEDEIARITEGPGAEGWSPVDAALLRAADELVADACIAEGTWAVLAGELDEQQLLDVVFTVGAYDLLAMLLRTVGVELDADLQEWKRPSP